MFGFVKQANKQNTQKVSSSVYFGNLSVMHMHRVSVCKDTTNLQVDRNKITDCDYAIK